MNSNAAFTINSETEELLVHFLDGTLSSSDQDRFETLLRENPSFAEEVRAITSFDEMLDDAHLEKRWTDLADTAFLSEMQQQFAQAAVLGTATVLTGTGAAASAGTGATSSTSIAATVSGISASSGGAAGTGLGLATTKTVSVIGLGKLAVLLTSATITKVVLLTVVCGGIGYGVWKYQDSKATSNANSTSTPQTIPLIPQQQSASASQQNTAPEKPASSPASVTNSVTGESSAAKAPQTLPSSALVDKSTSLSPNDQTAETISQATDQDNKTSANIESSAALDLRIKIEQLVALVRTKEQNGDKAGLAFDAKKLAMLERTAGKLSESNEHFEKALKAAQSLKLHELEGEIRAELALLFKEQGNPEKALISLREAVKILSAENSSKATKWIKELERWEKR